MNPEIWWYVTRVSGIVGWLLLSASVLWGILLPSKLADRPRPAWILDLHRWLAGLTVGFVGLHIVALVADSYVTFGLADVTVPFASDWKPAPVAFGVLAVWLLAFVEVTSIAMKRLPRRVWHGIHLTSYATFFLASLHGTLAGTDAANRLYQVTSLTAVLAVVWATLFRIVDRRPRRAVVRRSSTPTPAPESVS